MSYQIAIPSYKRSKTLWDKTLMYLENTDVSKKCITIFVANKVEYEIYRDELPGYRIVVGVPTLRGQRKFIRNYYPEGTNVFSIDDDIEGLYYAKSKLRDDIVRIVKLDAFLNEAFGLCKKFNVTLWGVSAVYNPFFMYGKGVSFDLKYICGGAYGEVISYDKKLDVELEDKEDFERSIRHFISKGAVIRFNEYALNTQGYKGAGGMQETRTKQRVTESAHYLLKRFPKYCKLNTGKKNQEFTEIKLIKQ